MERSSVRWLGIASAWICILGACARAVADLPQQMVVSAQVPFWARLHPVLVHVPVAALPVALIAYVVWLATGRQAFARADVVPLFCAALFSVAAVITGDRTADTAQFSEDAVSFVQRHETAGILVMVLALLLVGLRIWRWNRLTGTWQFVYALGLFMTTVVVGITGYLGACIVYGPGHLKP